MPVPSSLRSGASPGLVAGAAGLCLVSFGMLSSRAFAQDGPEEVVVVGQKIDRSLQDTPASVRVVTAGDIEDENINHMYDVLERSVNVTGDLGMGFRIRGIDSFSVSGGGNSYLASVYSDGAALPYRAIQERGFSTWDVQQVELLRGPQSTLQGRNALAGAIVMSTVDPTYEWEFKGRLGYGEEGREERAVAFGGPLVEDTLAVRVAAEGREFDGFNRNVTRDDYSNFEEDRTLRLKLLYEPEGVPDLRAMLTHTRGETDYGVQWVNAGADDPFADPHVDFDAPTHEFTDTDMTVLEVSYDVGPNWQFTSTTAYSDVYYGYEWDGDASPVAESVLLDDRVDETISQEFLLNFDYRNFSGVVGAYYSDLDVVDESSGNRNLLLASLGVASLLVAPPELGGLGLPQSAADAILALYQPFDPAVLDTDFYRYQNVSTGALFVDFSYSLSERLDVFGGLRYDREAQENEADSLVTIVNVDELPDPANPAFDPTTAAVISTLNAQFVAQAADASGTEPLVDTDFTTTLPKAGFTWHWTDDMSTSFTVQKGYRSGGVGSNIARSRTYTYDPEYTRNYELSFRSQWLDGRLTANANVFYLDWEDQQVTVQLSGNQYDTETVNSGSSEVMGLEVELFYAPGGSWSGYAGIGRSETEFDEFEIVLPTETYDLSERAFREAPGYTANLGATYHGNGGLMLNVNANYQGDSLAVVNPYIYGIPETDPRFDPRNDSRTLVNVRLGYEWGNVGGYLTVTNLLGEEYITNADAATGSMTLGYPRLATLRVETRF